MTLSESIEAATQIVRCYPNGGQNAGKGYIGALAAILGKYPRQIALRCAEPATGVVLDCKFLPTVADLVKWLEHKVEPLHRDYDREKRIAQQLKERDAVPFGYCKKGYTYSEFLEWAREKGLKARPIGATEPGGYLGPEE